MARYSLSRPLMARRCRQALDRRSPRPHPTNRPGPHPNRLPPGPTPDPTQNTPHDTPEDTAPQDATETPDKTDLTLQNPGLFSLNDIAKHLGHDPTTLRQWHCEGCSGHPMPYPDLINKNVPYWFYDRKIAGWIATLPTLNPTTAHNTPSLDPPSHPRRQKPSTTTGKACKTKKTQATRKIHRPHTPHRTNPARCQLCQPARNRTHHRHPHPHPTRLSRTRHLLPTARRQPPNRPRLRLLAPRHHHPLFRAPLVARVKGRAKLLPSSANPEKAGKSQGAGEPGRC